MDFSLVDFSSPAGTSYCFRAVQSDGSVIGTYASIPEISTEAPPVVSSVSLNGNADIALIEGTTTLVMATGNSE